MSPNSWYELWYFTIGIHIIGICVSAIDKSLILK
jgi:hypothetical protein